MIVTRRVNDTIKIIYVLNHEDAYRYESLFLFLYKDTIKFTRMYFDADVDEYECDIHTYKRFIQNEYESADRILFDKFVSFDRISVDTPDGIREVDLPIYKKDSEMFIAVKNILEDYENLFTIAYAIVIQTYFRRWRAKRRFSKNRILLFNEITLLPPKSIVPSFPGGSKYHAAFDRFNDALSV